VEKEQEGRREEGRDSRQDRAETDRGRSREKV
jgi:hypothetical protein